MSGYLNKEGQEESNYQTCYFGTRRQACILDDWNEGNGFRIKENLGWINNQNDYYIENN